MKQEIAKRIFSSFFLGIFFIKMVISIAPLIVSHFDKKTINAVIMQLEIEHDVKDKDSKEGAKKEIFSLGKFCCNINDPILLVLPCMISVDHDKHIVAFYPSVPTPPPNA